MTAKVYPHVLVETSMRDIPVVREWLATHSVASCSSTKDACCDLSTLRCGMAEKELQESLAKAIDTNDSTGGTHERR
jgi:hypothetical protein